MGFWVENPDEAQELLTVLNSHAALVQALNGVTGFYAAPAMDGEEVLLRWTLADGRVVELFLNDEQVGEFAEIRPEGVYERVGAESLREALRLHAPEGGE